MQDALRKLPSLDALKGFVAVARRMSITLAAEDLCLTQSAVSRQVQTLEAQIGVPLLDRQHRRIALTDAGRRLYKLASPWLDQLGDLVTHLGPQPVQSVTVSASVAVTALWLLPRLGRFQAQQPQIDVRVSTTYQFVDMEREGIDLALRYGVEADMPRGAERLFDEQVVPVASPALAQRIAADPSVLATQALIEFDDKPRPWVVWDDWRPVLGLDAVPRQTVLRFNLYDQVVQAAQAGHGLALGRLPLVQPLLDDGRLVAFNNIAPRPSGYAHWLLRSTRPVREEADVLARWIEAEAVQPS
jgi:LysR family glycine cleavage system transcriptional activator